MIEDVLMQIKNLYFPVDFVVVDTTPVKHAHVQILIILGRPFLATTNAVINCKKGVVKLSFDIMSAKKLKFINDDFLVSNILMSAKNQILTQMKCRTLIQLKKSIRQETSYYYASLICWRFY